MSDSPILFLDRYSDAFQDLAASDPAAAPGRFVVLTVEIVAAVRAAGLGDLAEDCVCRWTLEDWRKNDQVAIRETLAMCVAALGQRGSGRSRAALIYFWATGITRPEYHQ